MVRQLGGGAGAQPGEVQGDALVGEFLAQFAEGVEDGDAEAEAGL
ncbi:MULTISPECIES: hypothetical protein [unclassified Streptomyces]